ncbi:enoyl-CoA hydratase-related protein [Frankia sp. Cas3]|uniref:enoyl-CoA hydratase-related protein n=1 Tax=Frankia sp. Cas3 TaxID=3073926 RepID=UPI003A0FFD6C
MHVTVTAAPEVVLCDVDSGVATLTLHRPERKNAWTLDMERAFFDLLDACDDNPDVRVVLVTGAGTSFCPGMDMGYLDSVSQGPAAEKPAWRTRPMTHARSLRKPTIAVLNGACAGIGLVQALSCDLRFAAAGIKIAPSFTRRGLPAEFGVSWLLTRMIGPARAADLLISSRVVLAQEALALGLVDRVFPPDELMPAARAYAVDLVANCAPVAMAAVKAQLAADWGRTLADAQLDADALVRDTDRRIDFREGVAAFLERRPPDFRPLPPR